MKRYLFVFLIFWDILGMAQVSFYKELADSAYALTFDKVVYNPSYVNIAYPNGDVPAGTGVCTDVVIRAYRKMGVDLQRLVHEDIRLNFGKYPKMWGLKQPDKNIDHRRVPNLMTFFSGHGVSLPISTKAKEYTAGDIVCWNLGGNITHIGIVSNRNSFGGTRPLIIHNIGSGQVIEDCLFSYKIIGHYRFEKK